MSPKELIAAGMQSLKDNSELDLVYVTSDAEVFANENLAVLHSRKLADKEILAVDAKSDEAPKDKPKAAVGLIAAIEAAQTTDEVAEILGDDSRKTVKDAAEKRIAELTPAE